jgi:hypothetical protein
LGTQLQPATERRSAGTSVDHGAEA